ncbi:nucleotide exchange factor GrpE [Streptomyces sp. NPDC002012]|uniref:nucleotide exchange factor GrpE n=1 Tax=unclassified Streptomyces TaxID=2593676 RepID=UPI002E0EB991|nr:nucleotide exchange factor GrpE [Streptomyces sp. NBC_01224]
MSKNPRSEHRGDRSPVVVRDLRRATPVTLRDERCPDASGPAGTGSDGAGTARPGSGQSGYAEAARLRERIAELTADLQRVKAEYDNYRKRVRRDRLAIREIAVVNILTGLLPALDVLEEIHRQGDDHGAVTVLSDVLEARLAALGLRTVGAAGEPFDPHTHEAITYDASGAAQAVCTEVLRHGYRVGDHLLRPAQVAVAGPAPAE